MKSNLLLLLGLIFLASCGNDKPEPASKTKEPENMQQALEMAKESLEKAQNGEAVEPVNFRELQDLLPEKAGGYARTKLNGETSGAMNIKISRAEGRYETRDGKRMKIEIMDTGGFGMAMMSIAAWSSVTIDREDDNGYERTGTLNGYKSYEKYRNDGSESSIALIVGGRFVVNASCGGCDMSTLRNAIGDVNLRQLKNK